MQVFNSLTQIAEAIGVSSSRLAYLLIDARLIYAPPEIRHDFTALLQPPSHRINAVFYEAFTRISLVLFILSFAHHRLNLSASRQRETFPIHQHALLPFKLPCLLALSDMQIAFLFSSFIIKPAELSEDLL